MNRIFLGGRFSHVWLWMAAFAMMVPSMAMAQNEWSQSDACPGWNNPSSFTSAGSGNFKYQGRKGTAKTEVPSALTGKTGATWSGSVVAASAMATTSSNS